MKKYFSVLLSLLFAMICLCFPVAAFVEQGEDIFVTDAAGVLSESTEQMVIETNERLMTECAGAQIAVVFVNYLDGYASDEYANRLFNDWGVGDAQENNGMLLLAAVSEGKGWLATGSGINDVFTDEIAGEYLNDYFWDDFDRGNYDEAVETLLTELSGWYANYYGVGSSVSGAMPEPEPESNSGFVVIGFLIVVFMVIVVFAGAISRRRRYYSSYRSGAIFPFFFISRPRHGPHVNPPPRHGPRPPRSGGGFDDFGGGHSGGGGAGRGGFGGFGGGHSGGGGAGRR